MMKNQFKMMERMLEKKERNVKQIIYIYAVLLSVVINVLSLALK